jgi:hypothetical protein
LPIVFVELTVRVRILEPVPPAERVKVPGLNEAAIPVGTRTERVTVPAKPFRLDRVTVVVPDAPC